MKNFNIFLVVILTLLIYNISVAYTGYRHLNEPLPTSSGQLLYEESGCVMCHGIQGGGNGFLADGLDPRPRDFTDYRTMSRLSDIEIYTSIRNGISGTAMPKFNFTDNQIDDIIEYLRQFAYDSSMIINTCLNKTTVINTDYDISKMTIEIEQANLIEYIFIINKYSFRIKPAMHKVLVKLKGSKTIRINIRIIDHLTSDKSKIIALIIYRISDCIK